MADQALLPDPTSLHLLYVETEGNVITMVVRTGKWPETSFLHTFGEGWAYRPLYEGINPDSSEHQRDGNRTAKTHVL